MILIGVILFFVKIRSQFFIALVVSSIPIKKLKRFSSIINIVLKLVVNSFSMLMNMTEIKHKTESKINGSNLNIRREGNGFAIYIYGSVVRFLKSNCSLDIPEIATEDAMGKYPSLYVV
jgi:hypothetical protein